MTLFNAPAPGATEQERVYHWFKQQQWSETAYLELTERSNHLLELADGALLVLPMPSLEHQRVLKRLFRALDHWLETHQAGEALFAAHPVRLRPGLYREPDLMAWHTDHLNRLGGRFSDPPDMAVEILSPSNSAHDTETKFTEYAIAGITEYWLVDPATRTIRVYALQGAQYALASQATSSGQVASTVWPGFSVTLEQVFGA